MPIYKGAQLEKTQKLWTSWLRQPRENKPSRVEQIVQSLSKLTTTLQEKGSKPSVLKALMALSAIVTAFVAIKNSVTEEVPQPTEPKRLQANTDITKIKEAEYQEHKEKPKTVTERIKSTLGLGKPAPAAQEVTAAATGFSPEVQKAITDAATKVGVSPTVLSAFIDIESKGNPKARSGSFVGLGQIGEPAWKQASKEASLPPITKQNDPRLDPTLNAFATAVLIKQYTKTFQDNGVTPTVALLYAAHNLGPSRAVKMAKGEIDKGTEKAVANQAKELKVGGAKSYLQNVEVAVNKRLDKYAAATSTATPTPVAQAAPPAPAPAKVASATRTTAPSSSETDPNSVSKPLNNEKPKIDYIKTAQGTLIEIPV